MNIHDMKSQLFGVLKSFRAYFTGKDEADVEDASGEGGALRQESFSVPLLPKPPSKDKAIRIGAITITLALGTFTLWGTLVPLDVGIISFGSVVVADRHKRVQHLEGGIIGGIYVDEGDIVEKGSVLIELNTVRDRSELYRLEAREWSSKAEIARLDAEKKMREHIVFPAELVSLQNSNSRVADIISGQSEFFYEKRNKLLGELEILKHRIEQLRNRIAGLELQRQALENQESLYIQEINTLKKLVKEQIEEETTLLARRREKEGITGEKGARIAEIAGTEVQISEAKQQSLQLENNYRTLAAEQLNKTQDLLYETVERLYQVRDVIKRSKVLAPSSGIVIGLSVHTVGGIIPPGEPLMNIVPQGGLLVSEVKVRPTDIDSIVLNQEARLRMSALKLRTTPELIGRVIKISPDAFTDQNTGESYYTVQAEVLEEELEKLEGETILPGMPVEIMFKGDEKTVFSYISEPVLDILRRAWRDE